MAAEWNKTLTQGDDWVLQLVFTDANGDPYDITGYEFWYTAKAVADSDDLDAAALISLDPSDFTLDDSGSGTTDRATALVTSTVTHAIAAGTYYHDVQIRASGRISTWLAGQLVIESQITRRTT